ncbi:DUF485 domain-containing protein [Streptacidiphilus sp. EB129]|uniref:DUF485 domain-containing protein n=1 Tax=Streptacidiphilus sp. EB129 TaxID=3156262 RepID=UPI0035192620
MSSSFQPHRHRASGASAPPDAPVPVHTTELGALRRSTLRLSRGFAVANAACFAVTVLLAVTASGLLGTQVFGQVNLGMVLALGQGVLLLWTAAHFDRRSARICDPVADELLARHEAGTSYERAGHDRQGYDRPGYERPGYERPGYERAAYDRAGFERGGYDGTVTR